LLQNTEIILINKNMSYSKGVQSTIFIMDTIEFEPKYKVTYPCHEMDSKPTVKFFAFHNEMEDWVHEEVQHRIDYTVQHSPFTVSEEEYKEIEEYEYYLVRIEEV